MNLGQKIIDGIEKRRIRKRQSRDGPIGDFWRDGGNAMLYDLPVTTGQLVIDAGGYRGEWSAGMLTRYGCRCRMFEPIPQFASHCRSLFRHNRLVTVEEVALGARDRKTRFTVRGESSTEFDESAQIMEARVVDISRVLMSLDGERVACFKLNIEGGEYEVLERVLETGQVSAFDSLLIQFHRRPPGYATRYRTITDALANTHSRAWCYEYVWEKWIIKSA